jgi:ribonucleoside-triphosphate reductase
MDLGLESLSKTMIFSKYAKYLDEVKRRETWEDIVDRYENMLVKKFPHLRETIVQHSILIREKKVLPSMRALQFAGKAAEVNPARIYNCCFLPVDSLHSFSEAMFLLLGGTGVGYSVQQRHIEKLPSITKPSKERRFLIADSIEGWADAVKALMKAFLVGKSLPKFDFRDIRPKGARLITAGGKAPGAEPLKLALFEIQLILERKNDGDRLTPLECHDIMCHLANAVLAGGIRRAALIALFDISDEQMLTSKYGKFWEQNEQRGRANNSAVLKRGNINKEQFFSLWKRIEASETGEPGIYWTNNEEWGVNPCVEVALRAFQFCNLCEINVDNIESQKDLNKRAIAATFFGTLQASFTDFHYLRPIWQRTTEKEALIGIGMTGICSGKVLEMDLVETALLVNEVNEYYAKEIGINPAARRTLLKPSGTTSGVLSCSSGIHEWYDFFYIRTVRFNKNEAIAQHFLNNHPELCEDDILRPHDTLCVRFPIKAPEGAIIRGISPVDTLERVRRFSNEWIKPGHKEGDNTHNVSVTISVKPEEWEIVGEWMWENKDIYSGISVLNFDGGNYKQAPFESITEEEYNRRSAFLKDIDLTNVIEEEDNVQFGQTSACAGGACNLD